MSSNEDIANSLTEFDPPEALIRFLLTVEFDSDYYSLVAKLGVGATSKIQADAICSTFLPGAKRSQGCYIFDVDERVTLKLRFLYSNSLEFILDISELRQGMTFQAIALWVRRFRMKDPEWAPDPPYPDIEISDAEEAGAAIGFALKVCSGLSVWLAATS